MDVQLETSDPSELEAARQRVFAKVGHNVICLQHMEQLLKVLLTLSRFDGSLSEIKERLVKQKGRISKMTLGMLVAEIPERLLKTEHQESSEPAVLVEPWFAFTVRFTQAGETLRDLPSQLELITDKRNALIHHFIDRHNLHSIEGCNTASAELDALLEEVTKPYEFVLSLARSLQQLIEDIRADRIEVTDSE
jgi:hypothetical protein